MTRTPIIVAVVTCIALLVGCNGGGTADENGTDTPAATPGSTASMPGTSAGHGGPIVELGTSNIGPFTVRASRDEGEITAGGDAPIDVWLTGGDIATVAAVRFWIGSERGDESVRARADIEDPDEPNRWHTHAEIPDPMPVGSKLWVEIETDDGATHVGSFDLNA